MTTPFVVLSTQRSGSTWAITALNSHPTITAYGELFLTGGNGSSPWGARDLMYFNTFLAQSQVNLKGLRLPHFLFQYMNELYSAKSGQDAIGFKLMYSQIRTHPWLLGYLLLKRPHIIHLIRVNTLDVLLSRKAASIRGKHHALVGEEVQQVRIRMDTSELLHQLIREERKVQVVRTLIFLLGLNCREFHYENLLSTPGEYEKVLRFLDVRLPDYPLKSSLRKLNNEPYETSIENYEEVKLALEGTKFAALLDAPRLGNTPENRQRRTA